ncbi:Lrp/AsnC family transcriptional regulator [Tenacibaculum piscium]|uniref:AsnC family transcriptional regulator n=1 Tax=Tenacibaculum piscium TaxID=1458515 RepID=A0A2H1YJG2_9FLAO|nr:Lrp/AsnC family transcriptional regulator [Tenacibaculum piscium]MBE7630413.1 winged helix-turn-helix transcriptional regulator [Tenacibaculum piscium]MBE7671427.1 winged helix-turn-helix transcriptional regulator [Tenacibaculum piscium]MBE7690984.1 winged helix-turn-helix transcriptional regulator [Tenacibaculum piscium]MCG8184352.1 Lrp/AsnC family transcriptional regulator [Tenacibaculum piscium]MCG8205745.1 Lrp/AsnC family transcriptional regulator [Tenacibaculum piscium]
MIKLDEVDLKIIRILQEDCKKTAKEISQSLNLTVSPIYDRIRRLEKLGVIKKYVAILDKNHINRPITAICMVSLRYHNQGFMDKFEAQIKELKEVQKCYHMAGKVDYFLHINLPGIEDYHDFVRLKLSKIENIGVLESSFVLKEIIDKTAYYV